MLAGEIITRVRIEAAEPNTNRWTDAYLLTLISDAATALALEVDHPEASTSITTVANKAQYQMVDCIKILRVYVGIQGVTQQELFGTDIFTLEGDILEIYDQSSSIPGTSKSRSSERSGWLMSIVTHTTVATKRPGTILTKNSQCQEKRIGQEPAEGWAQGR